jgi:hypothetical protein
MDARAASLSASARSITSTSSFLRPETTFPRTRSSSKACRTPISNTPIRGFSIAPVDRPALRSLLWRLIAFVSGSPCRYGYQRSCGRWVVVVILQPGDGVTISHDSDGSFALNDERIVVTSCGCGLPGVGDLDLPTLTALGRGTTLPGLKVRYTNGVAVIVASGCTALQSLSCQAQIPRRPLRPWAAMSRGRGDQAASASTSARLVED